MTNRPHNLEHAQKQNPIENVVGSIPHNLEYAQKQNPIENVVGSFPHNLVEEKNRRLEDLES